MVKNVFFRFKVSLSPDLSWLSRVSLKTVSNNYVNTAASELKIFDQFRLTAPDNITIR